MSHQHLDLATRLHAGGFRVTPQRQLILDAICAGKGHTTADEVYTRVRAKAPAVNRATVYRTLEFLCTMRLVVAANIGGHTVYEIAGENPHHHLVCLNCGQTEALSHADVKPFFIKIEREYQFSVETDHLALFGVCRKCRANRSRSAR